MIKTRTESRNEPSAVAILKLVFKKSAADGNTMYLHQLVSGVPHFAKFFYAVVVHFCSPWGVL